MRKRNCTRHRNLIIINAAGSAQINSNSAVECVNTNAFSSAQSPNATALEVYVNTSSFVAGTPHIPGQSSETRCPSSSMRKPGSLALHAPSQIVVPASQPLWPSVRSSFRQWVDGSAPRLVKYPLESSQRLPSSQAATASTPCFTSASTVRHSPSEVLSEKPPDGTGAGVGVGVGLGLGPH